MNTLATIILSIAVILAGIVNIQQKNDINYLKREVQALREVVKP